MNRRELLKSIAGVAAITPIIPLKDSDENPTVLAHELNDGKPYYLFVVDGGQCDVDDFCNAFRECRIRGGVVVAHDDVENFCRIYKLED